jgi:predicted nuclease of restriction endonuclease-like (RecB) superfamily
LHTPSTSSASLGGIIDKCYHEPEKALFFVQKTVENGWSRAMLLNFLDTDLYQRQGKAITNFSKTLPEPHSELAQQLTKALPSVEEIEHGLCGASSGS